MSKEYKIKINLQEKVNGIEELTPEYISLWSVENDELIVTKVMMIKIRNNREEEIFVDIHQGLGTIDSETATQLREYKEQNEMIPIENVRHKTIIERAFGQAANPDIGLLDALKKDMEIEVNPMDKMRI